MDSVTELLKKEHMGEFVLVILIVIYVILGFHIPDKFAVMIDSLVGKVVILLIVLYLFLHANPILAVLAAYAAFDLMRRSSNNSSLDSLQAYAPSEQKKMSQFTAYNQFPYTLEQEVVAKMAPLVHSGVSINQASYKPTLDNLHDATAL